MSDFFIPAGLAHIKKERSKAQALKKTQWWQRKLNERTCYYCEGSFLPAELTMDHKVPLVRGGYSTKANLVTACKACNTEKKYALPSEWAPEASPTSDDDSF
jgi:5-methylcytosine-specific restriction protein A